MSRATDTFDSPSKGAYRRRNVALLRAHASFLLDVEGKLVGDWAELVGGSGWLSLELLEAEGLVSAGQFIGVDTDGALIEKYRAQRPDMRWLHGDLFTSVSELRSAKVAVLNVDGYSETGATDARAMLAAVKPVIQDGVERFGEFALFWTTCLDSVVKRRKKRAEALRNHAETVVDVLHRYAPMRLLRIEDVLPEGIEDVVEATDFVGILGAFDIYLGEGHRHRMAALRLLL